MESPPVEALGDSDMVRMVGYTVLDDVINVVVEISPLDTIAVISVIVVSLAVDTTDIVCSVVDILVVGEGVIGMIGSEII